MSAWMQEGHINEDLKELAAIEKETEKLFNKYEDFLNLPNFDVSLLIKAKRWIEDYEERKGDARKAEEQRKEDARKAEEQRKKDKEEEKQRKKDEERARLKAAELVRLLQQSLKSIFKILK